jgi:hypothetical protein
MSFTENDRNFRSKIGKTFPKGGGYSGPPFVEAIAIALRADFGASAAAVKRIARLTRANERAVRNWFESKNGPSGEHLIRLMQHSDAVLGAVLSLCNRAPRPVVEGLADIRLRLVDIVDKIDALQLPPD